MSDRDDKGRFLTGNNGGPGRNKGSRNKLKEEFLRDFVAAWEDQGIDALNRVIRDDPAKFVAIAASLMPKESEAEITHRFTAVRWLTEQEWLASLTDQGNSSEPSMIETSERQSSLPTDEPEKPSPVSLN